MPELAILVVEKHPAKLVSSEQWTARSLAVAHPLSPVLEVNFRHNIMSRAPLIVLPHLIYLGRTRRSKSRLGEHEMFVVGRRLLRWQLRSILLRRDLRRRLLNISDINGLTRVALN